MDCLFLADPPPPLPGRTYYLDDPYAIFLISGLLTKLVTDGTRTILVQFTLQPEKEVKSYWWPRSKFTGPILP